MVFTLVLILVMTSIIMITNNNLVRSFRLKIEHLKGAYFLKKNVLEKASVEGKTTFCKLRMATLD